MGQEAAVVVRVDKEEDENVNEGDDDDADSKLKTVRDERQGNEHQKQYITTILLYFEFTTVARAERGDAKRGKTWFSRVVSR